jgi:hypothetical protein
MKSPIACLLILALVVPASARDQTPLEQARGIAFGSKIQVELKTRQIVRGRLGQMTDTSFTLDPAKVGGGPGIEMLFQDVSEIRSVESKKKQKLMTSIQVVVLGLPLLLFCGPGVIFGKQCDL